MNTIISFFNKNPFKDTKGHVVIAQTPNWQLLGAILAHIGQIVLGDSSLANVASVLRLVFILFWAYEELFRGVNLFRRCLGLFVIAGVIATLYRLQ